jgi:hypothetical protein
MKKEVIAKMTNSFEDCSHTEQDIEYWMARDLAKNLAILRTTILPIPGKWSKLAQASPERSPIYIFAKMELIFPKIR